MSHGPAPLYVIRVVRRIVSVCGRLLYLDPCQMFTRISMELHDKELVETGKGDADGILIFVRDSFPFLSTP